MLIVPDADAAVGWYKRALGAGELWDLGGVAGLEVGGAPFFVHETVSTNEDERSPAESGLRSVRVELFVDDPDGFIERALAAGATASPEGVQEHDTPWGRHRQGGFRDPFGHLWSVGDRSPLQRLAPG